MENKLKDALSKAKEADNAKAQVKDLIRDAEDDIGEYAKLKNKNVTLKYYYTDERYNRGSERSWN